MLGLLIFPFTSGHDFAADYWSYGVLIYELLTRITPFYANDDMTVYENILNGLDGVKFSRRISKHAEVCITFFITNNFVFGHCDVVRLKCKEYSVNEMTK